MRDIRAERSVWPVITQDPIIAGTLEGGGVFNMKDGSGVCARAGERFPVEALRKHIGCDGAVDCDDVLAPGFVDDALRGFASNNL